jgi:organic hydroperoxide reductase OsmC/OhrA/catechol 2,3-dioxygenase-like lactoylglutathione lyase family enzyme
VSGEAKPTIPGTADPAFRGDPTRWNPEELLVASLSQCHMLEFLAQAARAGVVVTRYVDEPSGTMIEAGGGGSFVEVILRPRVTVAGDNMVDACARLHEEAHRTCYIASSVVFPVRLEAVTEVDGRPASAEGMPAETPHELPSILESVMSAQSDSPPIEPPPSAIVRHLHHIGHVVRDIYAAITLYRRMGFVVPLPSFPTLAPRSGERPRAFGVGNTHVTFRDNFVELVSVADDRHGGPVGAEATLVPLQAPPEILDRLREKIVQTADRLSTALARFEGLHILVLGTTDVEATLARLTAAGVIAGGVNRVTRPVGTGSDAKQVSIGFVEIDSQPGLSPEGRLALAEDGPADSSAPTAGEEHPNGAVELVESVLCVPDTDLDDYECRYARYLQRPALSDGQLRIFDLGRSTVVIVAYSALGAVLPGEVPAALPAFVGYGIAVQNLAATRELLERADFPVRESPLGGWYVPAEAALGAAVIFTPLTVPKKSADQELLGSPHACLPP